MGAVAAANKEATRGGGGVDPDNVRQWRIVRRRAMWNLGLGERGDLGLEEGCTYL